MAAFLALVPIPEQIPLWHSSALRLVHRVPMDRADLLAQTCSGCTKAKAYRLPLHRDFLDGRSALDWQHSIAAYLAWRAGLSWRPARHGGNCAVDSYRDALHLVTQAFHSLPEQAVPTKLPPAISAVPSAGFTPRRPPASVGGGFAATEVSA